MKPAAPSPHPSSPSPAGSDRLHLTLRNRHPTWRINTRLLRRIALAACAALPPSAPHLQRAPLALVLLDAPAMARLNERFLGHQGPTDVITFDYALHERAASPGPGAARVLHGDLCICLDEARRQARAWGTTWPAELVRYVVHGLLHLCGYDDLAPGPRRELKRVEHRLVRRLAATFPFNQLGHAGNVRP